MNRENKLKNLTDLKCDICNKVIGKVFEGDLNGTLIVCFQCDENND